MKQNLPWEQVFDGSIGSVERWGGETRSEELEHEIAWHKKGGGDPNSEWLTKGEIHAGAPDKEGATFLKFCPCTRLSPPREMRCICSDKDAGQGDLRLRQNVTLTCGASVSRFQGIQGNRNVPVPLPQSVTFQGLRQAQVPSPLLRCLSLLGCTLPPAQQLLFSERSVKQNTTQRWKIDLEPPFPFSPLCSTLVADLWDSFSCNHLLLRGNCLSGNEDGVTFETSANENSFSDIPF